MGKNNINGKTFLEKRYSEDLELEVTPACNVPVFILQALRYMNTQSNVVSPARTFKGTVSRDKFGF